MAQEPASGYHVVFVYTAECGGYEGVRTWSSFENKAAFDTWYTDDIRRRNRVVEEGVTEERALELVDQTPLSCDLAAAVEAATLSNGSMNPVTLELHITNVALARILRQRGA